LLQDFFDVFSEPVALLVMQDTPGWLNKSRKPAPGCAGRTTYVARSFADNGLRQSITVAVRQLVRSYNWSSSLQVIPHPRFSAGSCRQYTDAAKPFEFIDLKHQVTPATRSQIYLLHLLQEP